MRRSVTLRWLLIARLTLVSEANLTVSPAKAAQVTKGVMAAKEWVVGL